MWVKNSIKKALILLLVFSLFLSIPIASYGESVEVQQEEEYSLEYLLGVMEFIKENYVYDVKDEELIKGAMKGLFYNLDEYSCYYTKEDFQKLMENISGDFVGIGVYVSEDKGNIIITLPIEGSPAEKAGLRAGDVIVSIDGKSTKGLSLEKAVELMKGEKGTKVKIGVDRKDAKDVLYFHVPRDEIKPKTVGYKIIDDKIGYIKISQFAGDTSKELENALRELNKKNITKVIVDLRDNPGGLLDIVVDVSRYFVPAGPIVHVKSKDGTSQTYYSLNTKPKYDLVVLVNENSASASEILAGAVQDKKSGTIVGVTTYGKGVVQTVFPLINGDGIKLTTAEYLTPNKRSIHKKGVVPDIVVEDKDINRDMQLEKAIEILKK